jgi:hypothetical protein
MIWIAIHWAQVTAGAGFALFGETWRFHHNCSARLCLHQQLHLLVPLPLGITIQPGFN